jgi:putative endonuclease
MLAVSAMNEVACWLVIWFSCERAVSPLPSLWRQYTTFLQNADQPFVQFFPCTNGWFFTCTLVRDRPCTNVQVLSCSPGMAGLSLARDRPHPSIAPVGMPGTLDRPVLLCYTRTQRVTRGEASLATRDDRRGLGQRGEDLAAGHLAGKGYEIVARNWRCEVGEVDLVVRDGGCLALVEVRTRRGRSMGSPEESITVAKQTRLIALGEAYVQAGEWEGPWRIDVVAVEMDGGGRLLRVDHYENAVTG